MKIHDRNVYSNDKLLAQNSAKIQLEFCRHNVEYLRKVDRNNKMENVLTSFEGMRKRNESFSPNQLKYIDGIYEAIWKGADFPSVPMHIDKKKKGIRY